MSGSVDVVIVGKRLDFRFAKNPFDDLTTAGRPIRGQDEIR